MDLARDTLFLIVVVLLVMFSLGVCFVVAGAMTGTLVWVVADLSGHPLTPQMSFRLGMAANVAIAILLKFLKRD